MASASRTPASAGYAERLLAVQQAFAEGPEDLSLAQLSTRLGLPPSSVHRLLEPLVTTGLVDRAPGRRYRIGAEMFRLSALVSQRFDLVAHARARMRELVRRTGQTCMLGVLSRSRTEFVVAEKIDSPEPLGVRIAMYEQQPLVWGSLGRSILAFLDQPHVCAAVAAARDGAVADRRPPDVAQLSEELHAIQRAGVAVTRGQVAQPELVGMSTPVFGADGRVRGALGLASPPACADPLFRTRASALLREQALALSRTLGYAPRETGRPRVRG